MSTAITAIREDINSAGPVQRGLSGAEKDGREPQRILFNLATWRMVTASAGGVTLDNLIVAAASPVLYPIGTAMKATGALTAMIRSRLDGVAVVAAGA